MDAKGWAALLFVSGWLACVGCVAILANATWAILAIGLTAMVVGWLVATAGD